MNTLKIDPKTAHLIDPNISIIETCLDFAIAHNMESTITWTHLKPILVTRNDKKRYTATYEDSFGQYNFRIKRNGKDRYTVWSSGNLIYKGISKDKVIYEFECQVNDNDITCLKDARVKDVA